MTAHNLSAPAALTDDHEIGDFACGDDGVDAWLRTTARTAQQSGSARTFVVCNGTRIAAFYCLSTATIQRGELGSARERRGQPSAVPAILLGQLGVDHRYRSQGIGRYLLRDAMGRVLNVSEHTGVVVMHLHASTEAARAWYQHLDLGFNVSRTEPLTLYLPLETIRQALLP